MKLLFQTHLHSEEGYTGEKIDCGLEVLQFLRFGGRKVVAIHAQVDTEGIVKLVQQLYKLVFLQDELPDVKENVCLTTTTFLILYVIKLKSYPEIGSRETVTGRHVVGGRCVCVEGVDVC